MGSRGDRQKTRLIWLIEELGLDKFKELVAQEMAVLKGLSSPYVFQPAQKHAGEWTHGHRDILVLIDSISLFCYSSMQ